MANNEQIDKIMQSVNESCENWSSGAMVCKDVATLVSFSLWLENLRVKKKIGNFFLENYFLFAFTNK